MKRIVILISGRGSNMQALLDATLPGVVSAVISNNPEAAGLAIARARGVPTAVVDHRGYPDRMSFEQALAATIDAHAPDLLVLAGFMRILSPGFVQRYAGRSINIHPSLLPAFAGIHTHRRALEDGVRLHGCTVHFVTAELDNGPIIAQTAVPVMPDDTEAALAARVLREEHRILPQVVVWFLEGRLSVQDGRVRISGALRIPQSIVCPEQA
jgi:phosphoribosylglycinamide formyltransferase-1